MPLTIRFDLTQIYPWLRNIPTNTVSAIPYIFTPDNIVDYKFIVQIPDGKVFVNAWWIGSDGKQMPTVGLLQLLPIDNPTQIILDCDEITDTNILYVLYNGSVANGITPIPPPKSAGSPIFITEFFEETETGATGKPHTLSYTPVTSISGLLVLLNGSPLNSGQFTNAGTYIKVTIPVYSYDKLSVSYIH